MGRVYLGRSPGGRRVAIKVIRAELAESPDFRARFAREVSAARKVSGIFTAPVVDADLAGPMPWLATSYIAGPSLGDAVARRGPMPAPQVLRLAAGLAEGLAAIHSEGVVHRDLKPSNVLLAEDGPRLIDFGISRSVEMSSLTRTGTVVGSPGFMSPEQAEGHEVGAASDIFSLGAVLTFAATGEGPFGEGSTVALLYRVIWSEPNTVGLPDQVRPVVERCLAKDPGQRPTAVQLLARLSPVQSQEPATQAPGYASAGQPPGYAPAGQPPGYAAAGQPPGYAPAGPASYGAAEATARPEYPPTDRAAANATPPPLPRAEGPTSPTPDFPAAYDDRMAGAERHGDGWPPEPDRYRGGRVPEPAHRRPSRRGWLIAVGAAAVLAIGAAAFLVGKAGHGSPDLMNTTPPTASPATAHPSSAPPTQTQAQTQTPGAATVAAIGSDLARSAGVRPTVQTAIDGVQACTESPQTGEATIQQAISTRQDILQSLQTLSVSGLPNGAQLVSTLTTAMQASINDDQDFQHWMADLASSGGACGSTQDPYYQAGSGTDNSAATNAKSAFLAIWNPMAPNYGQQTYTPTGF
jgi:Protein kinase domain